MLHYYFFKYWSRGLVGLMIFFVVGYFGLFTYALFATNNSQQVLSESAQLSVTPQLQQALLTSPQTQDTYKKSLQLFNEIQKLKENNQDTTKLENLYADSVKELTNQHPREAEVTLQKIETEIATVNQTLLLTPSPSGTAESISVSPEPSRTVVPNATVENETEASKAAEITE